MPRALEYNEDTAHLICGLLAEGKSLRTIVQLEGMPAMSTVFKWLDRVPEFAKLYTRAREAQADALADEIQDIADEDPTIAFEKMLKDGREFDLVKVDSAIEQWRKTRIDARKWIAAKLKPRKYGDKVELTGENGTPLIPREQIRPVLELTVLPPTQRPALLIEGESNE